MERPIRSNSYQQIYYETQVSDIIWNSLQDNSSSYNEELVLLKDQLKIEFWNLVEQICTPKQKMVLQFLKDGYTQNEMAKILGCNQSSITKCLSGSIDYCTPSNSSHHKSNGGIKKKMKKAIDKSPVFQELFNKINELSNI